MTWPETVLSGPRSFVPIVSPQLFKNDKKRGEMFFSSVLESIFQYHLKVLILMRHTVKLSGPVQDMVLEDVAMSQIFRDD